MNCIQMAEKLGFNIVNKGDGDSRSIEGIYCCDLLSIVMGRAKESYAWITVMGNINSIAVAVLSDVSCIVLSEGMTLDNDSALKAQAQNICVLKSDLPTFEIGLLIKSCLE